MSSKIFVDTNILVYAVADNQHKIAEETLLDNEIYNRGNNRENLFIEERNYHYFFKLYTHYIYPIADTYAYCPMRNH